MLHVANDIRGYTDEEKEQKVTILYFALGKYKKAISFNETKYKALIEFSRLGRRLCFYLSDIGRNKNAYNGTVNNINLLEKNKKSVPYEYRSDFYNELYENYTYLSKHSSGENSQKYKRKAAEYYSNM